jgi:NADP-dependent 3-hydroxy acid dehydrogenase YdfG
VRSTVGAVAAVTGAASGIGRALAYELASRGAQLALADIDAAGLAETAAGCESAGVGVTATTLDVAERASVEAWAEAVVAEHGQVDLVVNNAGVALGSTVEAMSYDDLDWLMAINFWGVVYGTKAFLPHLRASGDGHLVNLSSVFGLISVPTQAAYNASKFAVRGFSDALALELRIERAPVRVTTVHPGGIRTGIARNARVNQSVAPPAGTPADAAAAFERLLRTPAPKAARVILDGALAGRRRVLVGPDATVIDLLSRLPAPIYQGLLVGAARLRR